MAFRMAISALFCIACLGFTVPAQNNDAETLAGATEKYEKINFKTSIDQSKRTKKSSFFTYYLGKSDTPEKTFKNYLSQNAAEFGMDPSLDDIEITKTQKTPGGTIIRFIQKVDGIPVHLSSGSVVINNKGAITKVNNSYKPAAREKKGAAAKIKAEGISAEKAMEIAKNYLEAADEIPVSENPALEWFESADMGMELAWNVSVGTWGIHVNARNGRIINAINRIFEASGKGYIYKPDPLTTSRSAYVYPYIDDNNNTNSALDAERELMSLNDITQTPSNTFKLEGPYCKLAEIQIPGYWGPVDILPEESGPFFMYDRSQDGFEGTMCYYHLDASARYLINSGYYDNGLDSFRIDPHGWYDHNAAFFPSYNCILMGVVGIDAAEDATLILHEYGHAVEHHVGPGLEGPAYSGEPRAIWEGSSDYWAVSYKASVDDYKWDQQGYWFNEGNGRSADTNLAYPEQNDAYKALQIWSSALMRIWWDIGKSTTDTLFLQTLTELPQGPSMSGAAMTLINVDYNLYNGLHKDPILKAFDFHGLVQYVDTIPYTDYDSINKRFDDWDAMGPEMGDNEYFIDLNHKANLNISTISPQTDFHTTLEIFHRTGSSTGYFDNQNPARLNGVSLEAGQYYIVVDGESGDSGHFQLSVNYSQSLELYIADEAYSINNIIQPKLYVKNTDTKPLSNFTVGYYFTVENNKTPVLDDYYTPNCTPSLEDLGNGHYRIKLDFSGTTLNPGQRLPANGEIKVGVHYGDWSLWNKLNDYSQPGPSLAISDSVAIFNSSGELIYGSVPDLRSPTPSTPPELNLEAYILDEGYHESNTVKPRFYITNMDVSGLSDFTVKYYFTVENGKTPVLEDYWTPECTPSLSHISGSDWCVVLNFSGYTLQPGGRVPANSGIIFGLHYADWSAWNKTNDFSQPAGDTYAITDKIAVFDNAGTRVYGTTP